MVIALHSSWKTPLQPRQPEPLNFERRKIMDLRKLLLVGLLLAAFGVTSALAVDGGNPRKGKYLFKKNCKTCHVKDGEGGELTPLSKTMSQWDRAFSKKKFGPKCIEGVSEKELLDINQFLYDHAVDSAQPETCG